MKNIFRNIFLSAGVLTFCAAVAAAQGTSTPAASAPAAKSAAPAQDSTVKKATADGARLDFGEITEYDFGKIKENGGKKTGSLTFKNTGNKPLVITKVMISCKCTSIDYPKKPVMPGASGKITITYDPKKQKGVFHKAIQIYSNDSEARHIIFTKGEVVE